MRTRTSRFLGITLGLLLSGAAGAATTAPAAPPAPPAPPAAPARPAPPAHAREIPDPPDPPDPPEPPDIDPFANGAVHVDMGMRRAYLGASLIDLTDDLRAWLGAPRDAGIIISRVEPDSPAAKAGLKVGDVVTAANGTQLTSSRQLAREVRRAKQGDKIALQGIRERKPLSLTATVAEREKMELDVGNWFSSGSDEDLHVHIDRDRLKRTLDRARERAEQAQSRAMERVRQAEDLEKRMREMEKKIEEMQKKILEKRTSRSEGGAAPQLPD